MFLSCSFLGNNLGKFGGNRWFFDFLIILLIFFYFLRDLPGVLKRRTYVKSLSNFLLTVVIGPRGGARFHGIRDKAFLNTGWRYSREKITRWRDFRWLTLTVNVRFLFRAWDRIFLFKMLEAMKRTKLATIQGFKSWTKKCKISVRKML